MDNYLYIIIIIGLTIFIVFYGGHNSQNKIEYDTDYFSNLNTIILFENKLLSIKKNQFDFSTVNFYNIDDFLPLSHNIIPNFINCFYIKINPLSLFNINNIVDKNESKNIIMIIFNHAKYNNIELQINNFKEHSNNYGYFYKLKHNISVVGIYNIYNNSNEFIYITCFIIKKPFWYY